MPLIQSNSPEAVSKNIKAEMAAGKPHDQSIAIALSVAKRNGGYKPKGKKKEKSASLHLLQTFHQAAEILSHGPINPNS